MHLDRGIVRMYIQLDGLSTIPYIPNTLTHQSAGTDDAPQGPNSRPRYRPLLVQDKWGTLGTGTDT